MTDMIDGTPIIMKIIDTDTWSFLEHPAADFLFGDAQSSGSGGFTVVSAVGMQSVGKSSLLNRIARANVFKTHKDPNNLDNLLRHITRGVDLHVTQERFLLLDSQVSINECLLFRRIY
uniref:GB1/RHD3-type G domain-containing protein n=1 Tax=Tetranychus urticae TaxID=32264 RepID=T1JQS2_TETUR